MRSFFALFAFLAVLTTVALAWDKEDHEIFDLVTAIQASEGKDVTFYSWLDVSSTASTAEIAKAYRKKSMLLHPDKNPHDKKIHERFARLGVVSTILRNRESRDRYDFFYKNGVPVWRGTGYYYSRFRPGLVTVAIFLIIVTSAFNYAAMFINYRRDLERIGRFVKDARLAAWGPKLTPIEGQRKVKINLAGPMSESQGRWIDMVVDPKNVYILDPSGDMDLLDASTASRPALVNTWFIALVRTLYYKVVDRAISPKERVSLEPEDDEEASTTASVPGSGTVTPKEGRSSNEKSGGKRKRPAKRR